MAHTRSLPTDAKLFGQGVDGIGVDARVEVHGHLHEEDDRQDAPFAVPGPGEAKLVVAFLLGQLPLAVQMGLEVSLAVVVGRDCMLGMDVGGIFQPLFRKRRGKAEEGGFPWEVVSSQLVLYKLVLYNMS